VSARGATPDLSLATGVPHTLALERAATIAALRYEFFFHIPEKRAEAIRSSEVVRFTLRAPHRVVLDFAQPRDRVTSVRVEDRPVAAGFTDGHLIIPASATRAGENAIRLEFLAGDDSLNRNDDFLRRLRNVLLRLPGGEKPINR